MGGGGVPELYHTDMFVYTSYFLFFGANFLLIKFLEWTPDYPGVGTAHPKNQQRCARLIISIGGLTSGAGINKDMGSHLAGGVQLIPRSIIAQQTPLLI